MPDASLQATLLGIFDGTAQEPCIRRLIAEGGSDKGASEFLRDLLEATVTGPLDRNKLSDLFEDVAERHLCLGDRIGKEQFVDTLLHVVSMLKFLTWHSNLFEDLVGEERSDHIKRKLDEIKAIHLRTSPSTLSVFLKDTLKVKGRLRGTGLPLWLSPEEDLADCLTFAHYCNRLSIVATDPGFRFHINGARHLERIPNEHPSSARYDPSERMIVHEPTVVDGMYYEKFIKGPHTAGGARQFVSKLNNVNAIDWVEIVV